MPINIISKSVIYNSGDRNRIKDRLYIRKKGVLEDLVITGGHSVLVNSFNADEKDKAVKLFGAVMKTDGLFRLPACIDSNMEPYAEKGHFNIYHIALQSNDNDRNYGIYSNGLLVESCSKNYIIKLM